MEKVIKYNFLLCCSKFPKEFEPYDYSLISINIINFIVSYSLIGNLIINLFTDFKIQNILISLFYLIDIPIILNLNKLNIKKLVQRNIDFILPKLIKDRLILLKIFNLIISVTLSILITLASYFEIYFFILDAKWNNGFKLYCIFFITFYSFYIKLSCITYFFIFLSNLTINFDKFITNIKVNNSNLNVLIFEYLEIRHKYNQLIFVFNNIISKIISFNILPLFYLIYNKFNLKLFDSLYLINCCFFLIFSIIFHYFSEIIDNNQKYLNSLTDKNNFVKRNLEKNTNLHHIEINNNNFDNINSNELEFKNYLIDIENGKSIDWVILSMILNQSLRPLEIFGINISNSTVITKIISLSIFIIIGKEII